MIIKTLQEKYILNKKNMIKQKTILEVTLWMRAEEYTEVTGTSIFIENNNH